MPRSWKKETQIKNYDSVYRVLYEQKQSDSRHNSREFFYTIWFDFSPILDMLFWLHCPGSSVEEQKPSKLKVTGSIPVSGTILVHRK